MIILELPHHPNNKRRQADRPKLQIRLGDSCHLFCCRVWILHMAALFFMHFFVLQSYHRGFMVDYGFEMKGVSFSLAFVCLCS